MEAYSHIPVMPEECINALEIKPDGVYIDATCGLGGHSARIAERLSSGKLICMDRDAEALDICKERLSPFGARTVFIQSDFRRMADVLSERGIYAADGCLLDLGVSSLQLDKPERGFSYRSDAPLDMRMNKSDPLTAGEIVNTLSHGELCRILRDYGEERYAARIASAIIRNRPQSSTLELAETVASAMPGQSRKERQHPARRTFQALRIAVNDELGALEEGLRAAVSLLNPGGVAAILTFHSLEDRIVKTFFNAMANPCECPPSFPVCVCGKRPVLLKQVRMVPSEEECGSNSRSQCATLRYAKKLAAGQR